MIDLSIVLPTFNEESNVREIYLRLSKVLASIGLSYEILFVDDGSTDRSAIEVESLHGQDPRVKLISFSRNFGHQMALTAGIAHAQGKAVITLDADMQHPVELLPELVKKWREGNQIVITLRKDTEDATWSKRLTSQLFYRLFDWLADIELDANAADYRLMDREAAKAFQQLEERSRFLRGLTAWMGFRVAKVEYLAESRHSGRSKYSLRRMLRFALDGITSFSTKPLKLVALTGFFVTFLGFLYGAYVVYAKFVMNQVILGWTSTILLVLVLGGIQLFSIGVVGIYLGKVFEEVKRRPLYLVMRKVGFED